MQTKMNRHDFEALTTGESSPVAHLHHRLRSVGRSVSDGSVSAESICPITFERISDFPAQDIYITPDGIAYHRPSLKRWLQKNDTMPHNGMKPHYVIRELWPSSLPDMQEVIKRLKYRRRYPMNYMINLTLGYTMGTMAYTYAISAIKHQLFLKYENLKPIGLPISLAFWVPEIVASLLYLTEMAAYRKSINDRLGFEPRTMTREENRKADLGVEF